LTVRKLAAAVTVYNRLVVTEINGAIFSSSISSSNCYCCCSCFCSCCSSSCCWCLL